MRWLLHRFLDRHVWIVPYLKKGREDLEANPKGRKVFFLDIDGTIWPDRGPGQILREPVRVSKEFRDVLAKRAIKVVFVTNQTLFARSEKISLLDFISYIIRVARLCYKFGALAFLVCHHHGNADNSRLRIDCSYRKPSNKMIYLLASKENIDLGSSVFVGDRITDARSGNLAGVSKCILLVNEEMFMINEYARTNSISYAFFSVSYNGFAELDSWFQKSA